MKFLSRLQFVGRFMKNLSFNGQRKVFYKLINFQYAAILNVDLRMFKLWRSKYQSAQRRHRLDVFILLKECF